MKKVLTMAGALLAVMAMALPAPAQESARIHLLHGIPDTDVDVLVDGEAVFESFAFGDTQDLSALAGQTLANLQVVLAGTEDVAIDGGDLALPASGNYTAIAHLDASGTPTLSVFENDISEIAAGEGRLTVRHTAAAPAVDVLADGAVAFSNLSNPNEASADLPAGTISAEVVPTGATEPVVIGPADLAVSEGDSLIVYAVGSLDGESLGVLTETITGLDSAPTAVNTGTSPVGIGTGTVLGLMAVTVLAALGFRKGIAVQR
jgi:hypothetical protein